jgi:hypothetical protein
VTRQTVAVTVKGLNLIGRTVNEASATIACRITRRETRRSRSSHVIDPLAATAVDHPALTGRGTALFRVIPPGSRSSTPPARFGNRGAM